MTQDTSPSTKKTLFKVMECRKLFEQFTMLALIIGVCKALTVLTMKHCKNTIEFAWMKKMSIICSKWNLLTFDWIKLHNLCIYERQQLWIFNVLSSNLSSILGQIICCEMITSSEKLISKSKAMDRRIKKKKLVKRALIRHLIFLVNKRLSTNIIVVQTKYTKNIKDKHPLFFS